MLIDTDILIIGAGLSGVGFAIRLQQKYPLVTYEVYEKAEELGGTWWFNTYPGCACDVCLFASDPCSGEVQGQS
jgi:cation diffusion facilitator CzcD-associated flavoprotein CzcO